MKYSFGYSSPLCQTCGLCNGCSSPFMRPTAMTREKPFKKCVLVVGEAPGKNEDVDGIQFHPDGDCGRLLRKELAKRDIADSIVFTNAVRCRPPNNELKTKKEVKACRTFLIEDIERLRPRAILLLGNKALFSLTGKEGITKRRRQLMHHKLMDGTEIPMMAGFHPSYAIRDRNNLPAFQEDIDTFISMLNGEVEDQAAIESRILGKYTSDVSEIDVHRMHQRAKASGGLVSFDVETNSLSPYLSPDTFRITMLSLSDGQETLVVRLDSVAGKVDKSPALKAALHLLMDKSIGKIAHNGKYDMSAIWVRYGVEVKNLAVDTMLLHALMHAINTSHALEDLSMDMLGVTAYHEKTTHKSKATKGVPVADKWLAMATDEDLIRRAALDAACTYRIYEKLWAEALEEDARFLALNIKGYKITDVFSHIVMPCSYTLFCMERNGFPVDIDAAKALEASYQERLDAVTNKLKRMKRVQSYVAELRNEYMESPKALKDEVKRKERSLTIEFNPGSAQQVAAVLNRHYKIPDKLFNVTKTGLLSADTETLSRIETSKHKGKCAKFMAALREFRHLDKGLSTYLVGILKRIGTDNRVHSTFRQDIAKTGRLSSRNPNLQNSSRKHKDIRAIFKAPDGYSLIEGDYSQIELRILAAESGDKTLVRTYIDGRDIHDETARDVWKIPVGKEVSDDIRTAAKRVNFGIVYMISAFGLIRQIGGTEAECQRRINAVYKRFPGVKRWQNSTIRFAESQGRAYSLFGHWRDLQNAKYKPKRGEKEGWSSYKEATRQAVNAPIQGAAGFVMFVSMNKLLKVLRKMKLSKYAKIVNTVHDSLMLLVKDSHLNKVMKIMKEVMESEPVRWLGDSLRGIPIEIDLKVGKSWDAMQKVKVA